MCIVWWQNSIQSSLILYYYKFYGLQAKDQFVVRILPSSDMFTSSDSKRDTRGLQRRQTGQPNSQTVGNETVLSSSYNIWLQDPRPGAGNGTGYMFVPFGEVGAGIF